MDFQGQLLAGKALAQRLQRLDQAGLGQLAGMRIDEQVRRPVQGLATPELLPSAASLLSSTSSIQLRGDAEHLLGHFQPEQAAPRQDFVADDFPGGHRHDGLEERRDGALGHQFVELGQGQGPIAGVLVNGVLAVAAPPAAGRETPCWRTAPGRLGAAQPIR